MNKISSEEVVKAHRKREFKRLIIILSFIAVGLVSMVFDIGTGPAMLSPKEVIDTLLQPILGGEQDKFLYHIVYDIRLPVALMALVVGRGFGSGWRRDTDAFKQPYGKPLHAGACRGGRIWRIAGDGVWFVWTASNLRRAYRCVYHDDVSGVYTVFVFDDEAIWVGYFGFSRYRAFVFVSVYALFGAVFVRARDFAGDFVLAVR